MERKKNAHTCSTSSSGTSIDTYEVVCKCSECSPPCVTSRYKRWWYKNTTWWYNTRDRSVTHSACKNEFRPNCPNLPEIYDLTAGWNDFSSFFRMLLPGKWPRLCSILVGQAQTIPGVLAPGYSHTKNFCKFCRTFIPVPGTSGSSVRWKFCTRVPQIPGVRVYYFYYLLLCEFCAAVSQYPELLWIL